MWSAQVGENTANSTWEEIEWGILNTDTLIVIHSRASLGRDWVKTQGIRAFKRGLNSPIRTLIAIDLVGDRQIPAVSYETGDSHIAFILNQRRLNFNAWENHEEYEIGFKQLVRELKILKA